MTNEVIEMRIAGRSIADIAHILGITSREVMSQIQLGREDIQELHANDPSESAILRMAEEIREQSPREPQGFPLKSMEVAKARMQ